MPRGERYCCRDESGEQGPRVTTAVGPEAESVADEEEGRERHAEREGHRERLEYRATHPGSVAPRPVVGYVAHHAVVEAELREDARHLHYRDAYCVEAKLCGAVHPRNTGVRRVAKQAAHGLPGGAHADPPGNALHLVIVVVPRPEMVNTWLQRSCRVGRSAPSPAEGASASAPQSSLEANFTVMAARKKKKSVEAGMYQCHSNAEETR